MSEWVRADVMEHWKRQNPVEWDAPTNEAVHTVMLEPETYVVNRTPHRAFNTCHTHIFLVYTWLKARDV